MNRKEFASKIVKLYEEKGDVVLKALEVVESVSGYFTALRVLGFKYVDAKKYAVMNVIVRELYVRLMMSARADVIEEKLKKVEESYRIRPDYEVIYDEILKTIESLGKPTK